MLEGRLGKDNILGEEISLEKVRSGDNARYSESSYLSEQSEKDFFETWISP